MEVAQLLLVIAMIIIVIFFISFQISFHFISFHLMGVGGSRYIFFTSVAPMKGPKIDPCVRGSPERQCVTSSLLLAVETWLDSLIQVIKYCPNFESLRNKSLLAFGQLSRFVVVITIIINIIINHHHYHHHHHQSSSLSSSSSSSSSIINHHHQSLASLSMITIIIIITKPRGDF